MWRPYRNQTEHLQEILDIVCLQLWTDMFLLHRLFPSWYAQVNAISWFHKSIFSGVLGSKQVTYIWTNTTSLIGLLENGFEPLCLALWTVPSCFFVLFIWTKSMELVGLATIGFDSVFSKNGNVPDHMLYCITGKQYTKTWLELRNNQCIVFDQHYFEFCIPAVLHWMD